MIPYKVENLVDAPDLGDVKLGGYAGRLAEVFLENRIYSARARETIYREAVSAFSHPNDDDTILGYWRGEFWGKWIIGACRACRYSGNSSLKDFLRQAAHTLLSYQREDGYLGSYRNADFIFPPDPEEVFRQLGRRSEWCWNIWCRKYTLWGLLELYELLGDPAILDGCRRMADHLIGQLNRLGARLNDTGTFHGLPSGSILKPMLILYRYTGDERYLNLCIQTAEDWDRDDNKMPNLIRNALSGTPVRDWYPADGAWAKAYEMMSCLDGLLELYRVTGTEKYFDACAAMFENLRENEMNAFYSVGFNDQFDHAARQINAISEPCDVIHWMRLCYELFTLTGESRYMDAFELAALNPFLASAYRDGQWGARALRSHGMHYIARQMDFVYNHCCVNNIPRGFMNLAQAAVMRGRDGLYLNQFSDCDAALPGDSGRDIVSIRGTYTRNCRARVTIAHQSARPQALFIRVPAWSLKSTVTVNGVPCAAPCGAFLRAEMAPFSDNTVEIRYDDTPVLLPFAYPVEKMPDSAWQVVRWCSRSDQAFSARTALPPDSMLDSPRCTLRMGPVLLCRSRHNGNTEQEMFSAPSVFGRGAACRLEELPGEGQCRFRARFSGERVSFETTVCDFASAANAITDDAHGHSIWF